MIYKSIHVPDKFLIPAEQGDNNLNEVFCEWFINTVEERSTYLLQHISQMIEKPLDVSYESLCFIEEWFYNRPREVVSEGISSYYRFENHEKELVSSSTITIEDWYRQTTGKDFINQVRISPQKRNYFIPEEESESFLKLLICRLQEPYLSQTIFAWHFGESAILFDISLYVLRLIKQEWSKTKWIMQFEHEFPVLKGFCHEVTCQPYDIFHHLSSRYYCNNNYITLTYNNWTELMCTDTVEIPLGPYYTWDQQKEYIIRIGLPAAFPYIYDLVNWADSDPNDWGVCEIREFLFNNRDRILAYDSNLEKIFERGFC